MLLYEAFVSNSDKIRKLANTIIELINKLYPKTRCKSVITKKKLIS